MSRPGITVTHEEMVEHFYKDQSPPAPSAPPYRTLVCRLRKKLAPIADNKEGWIKTVRSVGYVFAGK